MDLSKLKTINLVYCLKDLHQHVPSNGRSILTDSVEEPNLLRLREANPNVDTSFGAFELVRVDAGIEDRLHSSFEGHTKERIGGVALTVGKTLET